MSRSQFLKIAVERVPNILNKRLVVSMRQLESKITHSGPLHQRPDPHILTDAVTHLVRTRRIRVIKGPGDTSFFVPNFFDTNIPAHLERQEKVYSLYKSFRKYTSNMNACGKALEQLVGDAIDSTELYVISGEKGNSPVTYGSIILPGSLDFHLTPRNGANFHVLVEAKNIREWIYSSAPELWELIEKACVFLETGGKTLPVIVSRHIHYSARIFFKRVGILGVDTRKQYFFSALENELKHISESDGLGFWDIETDLTPPHWVKSFFAKTIPERVEDYAEQFRRTAPILKEYAKDLAKCKKGSDRAQKLTQQLYQRLDIERKMEDALDQEFSAGTEPEFEY